MSFGSMGMGELLLIFAVVLLLFGGKKIPEIAKGLGKGIRDFKNAQNGTESEDEKKKNLTADEEKTEKSKAKT